MSRDDLMVLGNILKQTLSEYVPEQSIRASFGSVLGSDLVTLNFYITTPGGLLPATEEASA